MALGTQSLRLGEATVCVCGGQESMSQAPHCVHLRSGIKMGPATLVDTMLHDGLTDAFHNIHMGVTGNQLVRLGLEILKKIYSNYLEAATRWTGEVYC